VSFVLCDVLCFLSHKFVNTSVKVLKSTLIDFYSEEDISRAKRQLLDDVLKIVTDVKFPHTPNRRDGSDRIVREVDDIFAIFVCLDENRLLDKLTKYVASGPDSMPSVRLYEGDLGGIMSLLGKLHDKINQYGEAIAILSGEVKALQTRDQAIQPLTGALAMAVNQQQPRHSRNPRSQCQSSDMLLSSSVEFPALERTSSVAQSADIAASLYTVQNDWASAVASPVITANKFGALQSADDDEQSDASHGRPFTAVISRRSKRNRNQVSPPSNVQNTPSADNANPPRRAPLVFGKSVAASNNVTAAKKIRKKSVWCIDNLNTTCTVQDITKFMSEQLSVDVQSCYETKPRRRRGETEAAAAMDRKAFRVCIHDDDRGRLLDGSAWPDSVVIAQWFFKSQQSDDKRPRLDGGSDGASVSQLPVAQSSTPLHRSASPVTGQDNQDVNIADNDETILAEVMECLNDGGT